MKRKIFCTFSAGFGLLLSAAPLHAHHAFAAEYDENRRIRVSGIVTVFKWTNPHGWLYVDGKSESGMVTRWSFEMGSPGGLVSRGWKKTDLKKGDQVTVQGFGAKNGKSGANATTVTLPDGRKLFGGFATTPGAPAQVAHFRGSGLS